MRVDLSAIERSLLRMSNAPITTASFLDHRAAPERMPEVWRGVEARVAAVLLANPWLAGRIDAKAKQLVYAPGPVARSRVDRIFRIEVMAKVGMQTPYRELGAKLRASGFLAGNAEPLWRVTLMPEAGTDGEQTRYVLIASMSHVVGDGHTYYRLLNMITGAAPVEALSPERSEAVLAAVDRKVGHALNSDPWFQLAGLWGILKGTLWNWRAALPADGGSLVASWLGWLRVDPAKASKVRMFYVDEEYVASEKAKAKEEGLVDYVSTNDVITSWFLRGMDM